MNTDLVKKIIAIATTEGLDEAAKGVQIVEALASDTDFVNEIGVKAHEIKDALIQDMHNLLSKKQTLEDEIKAFYEKEKDKLLKYL
jgi:hypothetical protein